MSLSEMSKSTYLAHRANIRANGAAYALERITCPLERVDMRQLYLEQLSSDWLTVRAQFQRTERPAVAFMLTRTP